MDPVAIGAPAGVMLAVLGGLAARAIARKRPLPKKLTPGQAGIVCTLKALGHDPNAVLVQVVAQGRKAGMRVLTRDGRPLRYYRAKELAKLRKDPGFLLRYAKARGAI